MANNMKKKGQIFIPLFAFLWPALMIGFAVFYVYASYVTASWFWLIFYLLIIVYLIYRDFFIIWLYDDEFVMLDKFHFIKIKYEVIKQIRNKYPLLEFTTYNIMKEMVGKYKKDDYIIAFNLSKFLKKEKLILTLLEKCNNAQIDKSIEKLY